MLRLTIVCLLLLAAPWLAAPVAAQDDPPPGGRPSKQTPVIRGPIFKRMQAAQEHFEAKDYTAALGVLDDIRAEAERLTPYERATLWGIYASVHYARDAIGEAIAAYLQALAIEGVPEELRNNNLYALAQMYMISERYAEAIKVLESWRRRVERPGPDALALLAQAYYQSARHQDAEAPLLQAIAEAQRLQRDVREHWLSLLRAIYYEREEYAKAAKVLSALVAMFPKKSYWVQLSGIYGLMDDPVDQLAALHAAHAAGYLDTETDLLNLARLYLSQQAPFPAVQVLREGLQAGTVRETEDALQLYAQALALAHENEAQVEVLEKLASRSGKARHYRYLGQAHMELGEYAEAATALREAVTAAGFENNGNDYMLLGNALYFLNRFRDAREAFQMAAEDRDTRDQAIAWVEHLSQEIRRKQEISNLAGK